MRRFDPHALPSRRINTPVRPDQRENPAPAGLVAEGQGEEEVAGARDVRRWVELLEVPKVSGDAPMLQHLMDGAIGVDDAPEGVGTRFSVRLPAAA